MRKSCMLLLHYLFFLINYYFMTSVSFQLARRMIRGIPFMCAISFMCAFVKFVICQFSQFYNTQRTWQLLWWGCNIWSFTVAEAIYRANPMLLNEVTHTGQYSWKRNDYCQEVSLITRTWFLQVKVTCSKQWISLNYWMTAEVTSISLLFSLLFYFLPRKI